MEAAKKRLANSAIAPEYFWWDEVGMKGLKELIKDAEDVGMKDVRLEAHLGLDEDGHPALYFVLKPITGLATQIFKDYGGPEPLNFSHVCPPDCGGG